MTTGEYVQSLARGLGVIRAFSDEHPRQTVSAVAQRCDLSRSAGRRFLLTLTELGYVDTDGTWYWLTPQVLELGRSYLSSLSLPDLAHPHLTRLSAALDESSSLSVLDGREIVYIARVQVRRIAAMTIVVGTRFAAEQTAMGHVLLADRPAQPGDSPEFVAELQRVRAQGFCVIDHNLDYGLRSVAAPVRDRAGNTLAAVSVSVRLHTARFGDELVPLVLETAEKISVDVGHAGTQL
nr:IclR family transcriptional regulator C-terminal domain-containing protein [Mycolicibacter acidiphilus]